jgi:hypothetical protein
MSICTRTCGELGAMRYLIDYLLQSITMVASNDWTTTTPY